MASSQITAHIFWSFPNGMARTTWFSKWNFRFSHVNGKYPVTTSPDTSLDFYVVADYISLFIRIILSRLCSYNYSAYQIWTEILMKHNHVKKLDWKCVFDFGKHQPCPKYPSLAERRLHSYRFEVWSTSIRPCSQLENGR